MMRHVASDGVQRSCSRSGSLRSNLEFECGGELRAQPHTNVPPGRGKYTLIKRLKGDELKNPSSG